MATSKEASRKESIKEQGQVNELVGKTACFAEGVQQQVVQNPIAYSFNNQYVHQQQPMIQSQFVAQPVQYAQQPIQYAQLPVQTVQYASQHVQQGALVQSQAVSGGLVATQIQREVVKGESRVEYVPYEKTVIEYEAVQRTDYVPKEKKITDYYAVEYQTEYIPQVYQDRYIEYVPTERVQERVEYQAIQKQVVHQPVQQVQATQTVVQQPVVATQLQTSTVTVPVVQQSVQYVPTASIVKTVQPGTTTTQYVTSGVNQFASSGVNQYVSSGAATSYVSSSHLGVPLGLGRQGLTQSGVRTLGPVSISVVEEAIKKNQNKKNDD